MSDQNNITLGQLLDIWVEEDLKTGSLSNGTVMLYQNTVRIIKRHPVCSRNLPDIEPEHLQTFMDQVSFGGKEGDFDSHDGYCKDLANKFLAVLNHAFRFAVFPKKYISFNPMQYVILHKRITAAELFASDDLTGQNIKPISKEMYTKLTDFLMAHHPDSLLPVQISYFTGLRLGEACGLVWQDINLDNQYLTVRRSVTYDSVRHKMQIGTTKRDKVRIVDFGDLLTKILTDAKQRQKAASDKLGDRYCKCFYKEVREKNRVYFEYYHMPGSESVPDDYHEIDFVCRRSDGSLMRPNSVESVCTDVAKRLHGFENFHFHVLRHTFTTNLLANGAKPKDVQELLGHSSVTTTMNIYAHATRESKKASAKILDTLTG